MGWKGPDLHQKQLTRKITHGPNNFTGEKTHPDPAVHKAATGEWSHSPGVKSQRTAQQEFPYDHLTDWEGYCQQGMWDTGEDHLEILCLLHVGEEPKAGKGSS